MPDQDPTTHKKYFKGTTPMTSSTNSNPQDRQAPACKAPSTPAAAPLGPDRFSDHRLERILDCVTHFPLTEEQASRLQEFCQTHPDFKVHPDHVEPHPWQAEMQCIREAIPNSNVEDERPTFFDRRFYLLMRDLDHFEPNCQQLACLSEVAAMFLPATAETAPPPKTVTGVVLDEPPFPEDLNALIPAIVRVHDWLHARELAVTGTSATGCPCGGTCGRNRGAPNATQKGGDPTQNMTSGAGAPDNGSCSPSRPPEAHDPVRSQGRAPRWGKRPATARCQSRQPGQAQPAKASPPSQDRRTE